MFKVAVPVTVVLSGIGVWQLLKYYWREKRQIKLRPCGHGSVHIITNSEEWDALYPILQKHTQLVKVVGLDCEWVFSEGHTKPVALVQISTQQGLCLLVRLNRMTSLPATLRTFLSDRSILKVGVAVKDDGRKLRVDHGLSVSGCLDLRYLVSKFQHIYKCDNYGLQGIAKAVLGLSLNKEQSIRCSDWEADKLSCNQVAYAAADSQSAVDIFTKLVFTVVFGCDPNTRAGADVSSVRRNTFCRVVEELSEGLVDMIYRNPRHRFRNNHKPIIDSKDDVDVSKDGVHVSKDGVHVSKDDVHVRRAFSPRQRPVRFSCQVLAPDGTYLCMCDTCKADWYVQRNLGCKIKDNPVTIQLKVLPDTDNEDAGVYNLQNGEHHCVVCGQVNCYIKKFLVLQEYRKYFPREKKATRFHNVLLLCPSCYQVSSNHDAILRQLLAHECDSPLDSGAGAKTVKDFELQKVIRAAKALKLNKSTIPQHRVQELEQTLMDFYAVPEVSDELLEEALTLQTRVENQHYIAHGKKVVYYQKAHGGVSAFETRWRQYFIDTMKPRYLPPFWEVDCGN
ncbi:exonuclease 3'-5' domain-containing protein 2-like [Gigantopelta aegis]|uniref:exonuclease 3'-5' domain-containing protein 2-like n=1 Tax=Gigantopelta aegis TaxID=1735272 RepID=UPI001B88CEA6|nr:exonuclease 3'-5' domain-containing protein 2-like [Gigantopelta aegis]